MNGGLSFSQSHILRRGSRFSKVALHLVFQHDGNTRRSDVVPGFQKSYITYIVFQHGEIPTFSDDMVPGFEKSHLYHFPTPFLSTSTWKEVPSTAHTGARGRCRKNNQQHNRQSFVLSTFASVSASISQSIKLASEQ